MAIITEDLAEYGVVLIPPSALQYRGFVEDILKRVDTPADVREFESAMLINRAAKAIVSIAYIWHVSLVEHGGKVVTHLHMPGTNASVLLPFELHERVKKFDYFWNTVFPGSKRLMQFNGPILGDNTDVRQPHADELSKSCSCSFGFGKHREEQEALKLSLDGVFFEDGGFAGPNQLG